MRKHRNDYVILIMMLILMLVGAIVMYTIGPVRVIFLNAAGSNFAENYFFKNQIIAVIISIAIFIICSKVSIKTFHRFALSMLIGSFILCIILAVSAMLHLPFATCQNGACRWINVGISIEPAEFVKFSMLLYLAQILSEYRKKGLEKNKKFWIKFLGSVGLSLFFIVVLQKDLGSGIPIIVMSLFMLFAAGIDRKIFGIIVATAFVAGAVVIFSSPHRMERIATFMNSSTETSEDSGDAYHIKNALIAIGSGGLFGVGIGNSVQATGYLPESINDSVFAIMGETVGFVGVVCVLALFAILLFRIIKTANYLPDLEENLICIGVFAWVMTHVVVNIMAMTGLIPLTGITLPLLSYGGTSMMMTSAALGLVFQLSGLTSRDVVLDKERMPNDNNLYGGYRQNEYQYVRRRR